MVRNAEVILSLVELGLETVHTGDDQHELGRVGPHLRGCGKEGYIKQRSRES